MLILTVAHAQSAYDSDLDRYEYMCSKCLELRTRLDGGEQVSREEAEATIDLFLAINKRLKACESDMNARQRQRFKDVGEWFTTGKRIVRPHVLPFIACSIPAVTVSSMRVDSLLIPAVSGAVMPLLQPSQPNLSCRYHLVAEISVPDLSCGLRFGTTWRGWGGYVSFRSNFVTGNADYECLSDGSLSNGSHFWAGGGKRTCNMTAAAGLLMSATDWLSVYAGAGYGWRYLQWQDVDGKWAEVSDYSCRGPAFETGMIFSYRRLAFSAGVSSISFKTAALTAGIGLKF